MKLWITGASGFLGGFVVRGALAVGHEVFGLARSDRSADVLTRLGVEPVFGDLDDPASVDTAFAVAVERGAEAMINLASLGFGHAPAIVAAAEETGLRRAAFVSTTAVTTSLPAESKSVRLAAEEVIRASALDWVILRPTMIYGAAGDRNVSRLLHLLRRTPLLPIPGGGRRLQQPVHAEDLANAVVAAATSDVAVRRVYDVAGPEPLSFRQLLDEASAAVGRRPRMLPVPLAPAIAALRLYDKTVRRPRLKAEQLQRLAEDKVFDIQAARTDLGFAPRSFADGVREEAAVLWP